MSQSLLGSMFAPSSVAQVPQYPERALAAKPPSLCLATDGRSRAGSGAGSRARASPSAKATGAPATRAAARVGGREARGAAGLVPKESLCPMTIGIGVQAGAFPAGASASCGFGLHTEQNADATDSHGGGGRTGWPGVVAGELESGVLGMHRRRLLE